MTITEQTKEIAGAAPPAGAFRRSPVLGPGSDIPKINSGNEIPALSCQYKDKSFTQSKNCTRTSPKTNGRWKGSTHGGKPVDNSPTSVRACYNRAWTLKIWKKDRPGKQINVPFTCRTWRHEGDCRQFKGAQDFVRIKEALSKRSGWVYMVLTWPERTGNVEAVYRRLGRQLQHFRQWIKRNYARPGEPLDYIVLAEQHKDGWPHINMILHLQDFVAAAAADWKSLRQKVRAHAMSTGFGKVFWLEPVRNDDAIAGYFVKLCQEVSKTLQTPMKAPSSFRRLRSSKGLLPPVHKDRDYTGELHFLEEHIVKNMSATRLNKKMMIINIEEWQKERRAIDWYERCEKLRGTFIENFNMSEKSA